MTKEELKDLIAKKISGQGNQVDLGSALETILNELIDLAPERKPITIDLSEFELSGESTDVTSAIPSGYVPQEGDRVRLINDLYFFRGATVAANETSWDASFGYGGNAEQAASLITLMYQGEHVNAYWVEV